MAKKTVPTCLGHYDEGDTVCDGDPEGVTADERALCAWRVRCGGFKSHLAATGEDVEKYLTFTNDDQATVEDRDEFAEFCLRKAKEFEEEETDEDDDTDEKSEAEDDEEPEDGASEAEEGGDAEDDEEGDDAEEIDLEEEGGEEEDDTEEVDTEEDVDHAEPDDDDGDGEDVSDDDANVQGDDGEDEHADVASTDDEPPSEESRSAPVAKKRKSSEKPKGERDTNSKWAAEQRQKASDVYGHFKDAFAEGLNLPRFGGPLR